MLAQFVRFLYVQLQDCKRSVFRVVIEKDEFAKFILEFMLRMSNVSMCVTT